MRHNGVYAFLKWIGSPIYNLILDFKDKRAGTFTSEKTWFNMLIPELISILGFLPRIVTMAKGTISIPYFWVARYGGLSLASCVVLFFLITSRRPAEQNGNAIWVSEKERRFRYRFAQIERKVSKRLILPVFILALLQGRAVLPNNVAGRVQLPGFVCSLKQGTPIQGSVQILDMKGDVTSIHTETLDDHGFFVSDLQPRGFKPVDVRVFSASCPAKKATLPSKVVQQDGCVNDPNQIRQPTPTAMILIDCDGKESDK